MDQVKIVALTGGPCSGKTTALSYLAQKLEDLGIYVVILGEAATDLMSRNIQPAQDLLLFQRLVVEKSITDLRGARRYGKRVAQHTGKKVVILCDRGIPDCRAYVDEEEYSKIIRRAGYTSHYRAHEEYDHVFHMVTAALGAEDFYTLSNNQTRTESPEEARGRDQRTQAAWLGHPSMKVIDNSTSFEIKLERLLGLVRNVLSVPEALELERKYLVECFKLPDELRQSEVEIRQAYLPRTPTEERLRIRIHSDGHRQYFHTKKVGRGVKRIEVDRIVTRSEFERTCASFGLSEDEFLQKQRVIFVFEGRVLELDIFQNHRGHKKKPLVILECEVGSKEEVPNIPSWIKVMREITNEEEFTNARIWRDALYR